jgi:hypothetical protein
MPSKTPRAPLNAAPDPYVYDPSDDAQGPERVPRIDDDAAEPEPRPTEAEKARRALDDEEAGPAIPIAPSLDVAPAPTLLRASIQAAPHLVLAVAATLAAVAFRKSQACAPLGDLAREALATALWAGRA